MVLVIGGELVSDDDPRAIEMRKSKHTANRGNSSTYASGGGGKMGSILNFGQQSNAQGPSSMPQGGSARRPPSNGGTSVLGGLFTSVGLGVLETTTIHIPRISLPMINRPATDIPVYYVLLAAALYFFMGPIALIVGAAVYLFSAPPPAPRDGGGTTRAETGRPAAGEGFHTGPQIHTLH